MLFGSERSAGRKYTFKGKEIEVKLLREAGTNKTEMLRSTGLAIRPVYGDYRQKVEVSFDEGNVKKDKTSATFPLNFTGSLSFVTEYGVAYATSEATLDVQGNSKVKVTGEPKESETIKVTGLDSSASFFSSLACRISVA